MSSYSTGFAATASSYYEKNTPSVAPSMMVDGSLSTSWDAWGEYEGAWLAISTIDGYEYKINGFTINNGKNLRNGNDEYFKRNSRIKDCTVYIDGVFVGRYMLQDTSSAQTVSFNTPINGKQFKIVVDTVYQGTKYQDPNYGVCVTEIKLF